MKLVGKLLAATAALAGIGTTAFAADVVIVPPVVAPPPPPVVEDVRFDGPYWGVYGGIFQQFQQRLPQVQPLIGTQFGYNLAFGNFRAGFEVETEYPFFRTVDATLNGRVGFVLGSNILLYGQAGIGSFLTVPTWSAGGGVEFALGSSGLALFAEGKVFFLLGGGGGPIFWSVRGGVNYYADRENTDAAGDFDWGGLYFGGHVGRTFGGAPLGGQTHAGVQVGYNLSGGGAFVGGLEVETSHTIGDPARVNAQLNGRAGAAFGPILLYGEVGIGRYQLTDIWTAGGGAELALGTMFGLFVEGKAVFNLGGGGVTATIVNAGVNVHFGR